MSVTAPPVTVQHVEPRRIAAATAGFTRKTLSRVLIELLDRVYAVLA